MNQDLLIAHDRIGLYAVLDGMGGAPAGDVAAQVARDAILAAVRQHRGRISDPELLQAALAQASAAVVAEGVRRPDRRGLGTTVVACLIDVGGTAWVAHVGDSRAYLLRSGGDFRVLTRDHTVAEDLVAQGQATRELARRHPMRHALTRHVGASSPPEVDLARVDLEDGDRLLLCSDGIHGSATEGDLALALGSQAAPRCVARSLVDLALRGGGQDNATAVVVEIYDA